MGKCLKLGVLLTACVLAFGCAARQQQNSPQDETLRVERFRRSYEAAFDNKQQEASQQLISKARSALGTPYVSGGSSPGGFDCSGFVCWAYKSVGVSLPRTAREQSVVGKRITRVEDMRAGDIVAFRHPRRGYHTGIYVGDGKFIHSPRRRSTVRITSLDDPYFSGTFLGARRVKIEAGENLVAQAESRLNDFTEERAVRDLSTARKAKGKSKVSAKSSRKQGKVVQVASNGADQQTARRKIFRQVCQIFLQSFQIRQVRRRPRRKARQNCCAVHRQNDRQIRKIRQKGSVCTRGPSRQRSLQSLRHRKKIQRRAQGGVQERCRQNL